MKKVVLKLEVYDKKSKKKAMKAVSGLDGLDSISVDMKDKKLTVTGDIDPVELVERLKKVCGRTEIVTVGPAKEEKKKEEPKEQPKKEEPKKKDPRDEITYQYIPMPPTYYYVRSAEEDPNSCVIC